MRRQQRRGGFTTAEFDRLVLGEELPDRHIDQRIRRAALSLNDFSGSKLTAADCAASVNLSPSRFLHLFKEQTGVSFRAFRAWKRARHLLHFVNEDINLAHLAQDIGYPDFDAFQPFDPPLLRTAAARDFLGLTGSRDLPQRSGDARQCRVPSGAAVIEGPVSADSAWTQEAGTGGTHDPPEIFLQNQQN